MKETKEKNIDFKKVLSDARGLMRILYKAGLIDKSVYTAVKKAQKEFGVK